VCGGQRLDAEQPACEGEDSEAAPARRQGADYGTR
jgi:hypothetical protein